MPLCCSSRSRKDAADAETRRARIVPILSPSRYSLPGEMREQVRDPPPRYEEATHDRRVPIVTDEKMESQTRDMITRPHIRLSTEDDRSDSSSVLSIPSTQVTGITMAHTGATIRRQVTGQTNVTDSKPPSYYANSEVGSGRSSSPGSDGTGRILRHPVMGQDWRNWVDSMIDSPRNASS